MVPLSPPLSLSGTYALRITADPACDGYAALPAIARQRQYDATIASGSGVLAVISGGHFDSTSTNKIYGHVTAEGASFDVNDPMYYYSGYRDIAEVLPDGSVYLPSGSIDVSRLGNDLVGTLSGAIRVRAPSGTFIAQCLSGRHSVTFTNQAGRPAAARNRR
jgi:hypothetical protein